MDSLIEKNFLFSIALEREVAKLYRCFAYAFPQDQAFWWKIAAEEENHAALIRSGMEMLYDAGFFPVEILAPQIETVKTMYETVKTFVERFSSNVPSMEEAYSFALNLEESAGEAHYQHYVSLEKKSSISKMINKLNGDDKDHAERIEALIKSKGKE